MILTAISKFLLTTCTSMFIPSLYQKKWKENWLKKTRQPCAFQSYIKTMYFHTEILYVRNFGDKKLHQDEGPCNS